jgi:hypothetical protein
MGNIWYVLKNRMLRRIFGPKREEIAEEFRNLCHEKLCYF